MACDDAVLLLYSTHGLLWSVHDSSSRAAGSNLGFEVESARCARVVRDILCWDLLPSQAIPVLGQFSQHLVLVFSCVFVDPFSELRVAWKRIVL